MAVNGCVCLCVLSHAVLRIYVWFELRVNGAPDLGESQDKSVSM